MIFVIKVLLKIGLMQQKETKHKQTKHMLVHNNKNEFRCHVCHKHFALKCNLKLHMITHTKDKLYKCDICDKRFTVKGSVKTHMLVHNGIKEYQCEVY